MTGRDFGRQLRFYRQQTNDPETGKPLTQQKLGELLGMELGINGFTGAAVSDWERGESRLSADDRHLLTGLVRILSRFGGIKTLGEANLLLEAGNFRALNAAEKRTLFPGEAEENHPPAPSQNPSNAHFLFSSMNLISPAEFDAMLEKAKQGPPPFWPRLAASLTGRFTDNLTAFIVSQAIVWLWMIWLAKEFFIAPSLDWEFGSRANAITALVCYAAGSLILPALIGGMTNTKDNPYWAKQNLRASIALRLYVHQGAFVGYHTGYFVALILARIQNLLGLGSPEWSTLLQAAFPLAISYAGAQLVPYNLWLAYGRLNLRDGGIFFIFAVLGPLWALFFLKFYETLASPALGGSVVLSALTILAAVEAMKHRRKKVSGG